MASTLSRQAAIDLVSERAAATMFPELSTEQVEQIVDRAAREDVDGNLPSDEYDWTPTYDINVACADAWQQKAAEVANRFRIGVDGQQLDRQQLYAHCVEMADRWRAKAAFVWPSSR